MEHPVTELISNVNLPAAQLQVAMGIPLYQIPDIRRLFVTPASSTSSPVIDFETAHMCQPACHVIACRITAENPDSNFQPTSGRCQFTMWYTCLIVIHVKRIVGRPQFPFNSKRLGLLFHLKRRWGP